MYILLCIFLLYLPKHRYTIIHINLYALFIIQSCLFVIVKGGHYIAGKGSEAGEGQGTLASLSLCFSPLAYFELVNDQPLLRNL